MPASCDLLLVGWIKAANFDPANVRFPGNGILVDEGRDLQLSVLEELVGEINVHETGESSV